MGVVHARALMGYPRVLSQYERHPYSQPLLITGVAAAIFQRWPFLPQESNPAERLRAEKD